MLQVLERSKEEKCNMQRKLFNKKMGYLQINDLVNLLGSLDCEDFNDESSLKKDTTEYEGKTEDEPQ
jgi:hypothetical protein